ncbi:MAG: hypothetical protein C5B54_05190 [Acidobacteria bacterium]|nr:MAG: hypothetical protein C5B54_05190 [Acidobacteriota bacterium]
MPPKRLSLKQIPESERPREKLLTQGEQALSDAELLALILGSGTSSETSVQLAQRILGQFGGVQKLALLSAIELQDVHGVGPAKAAGLKAAFELSRRHVQRNENRQPQFSQSQTVYQYFEPKLRGRVQEEFWVVALDTKNRLIVAQSITKGTLSGSLVHPREVFGFAIKNSAASIIILHNHPSGDPQPSLEDRKVTTQIAQAGKLMGIELLDHVIIGQSCYFSFRDQGLL